MAGRGERVATSVVSALSLAVVCLVAVGALPIDAVEQEVSVAGPAGDLVGTLLVPTAEGSASAKAPVAGVVFITGSGLQDRDETIFGHKPFKEIADALAKAGIASLRCDDRGVFKSTGNPSLATTLDFMADAKAEVEFLRKVPGVDPNRVGVIGHSEGGLIGTLMAAGPNPAVDFAVLLAAPGISGREVLTTQTQDLYRAARIDPMLAAIAVEKHRDLMDAMESGADGATFDEALLALVAAQIECNSGQAPSAEIVAATAKMAAPGLKSPWLACFIRLDPAPSVALLAVPTLFVFGGKDTQVSPTHNRGAIEEAGGKAPVPPEIVVFDGLNHLFQKARTGLPDEYQRIKTGVEPEVITKVVEWLGKRQPRPQPTASSTTSP